MRLPDGPWAKDPEALVQRSIQAVFRDFRSQRSLRRTVAALNRIGVRLPRRDRRSGLRWAAPCIGVRGRDGGGVRRGQERRLT